MKKGLAFGYMAVLLALSLLPMGIPGGGKMGVDKVYHAIAYAILGLLLADATGHRISSLWVGVFLAFASEGIQDLVPWRDASLADALAGSLGTLAGVLLPGRARAAVGWFLATAGGVGHLPAGGTLVSALALVFLYLYPGGAPIKAALFPLTLVLSLWGARWGWERWGGDPPRVVCDEVVGAHAAVLFLPPTPVVYATAFLAFRLLDIVKPPPIGSFEKLEGPWGILADDLVAGVVVNLLLWTLVFFFGFGALTPEAIWRWFWR